MDADVPGAASNQQVTLNDEIVKTFERAKVFKHHTSPANSLDFSFDGELCASSSPENLIELYTTTKGIKHKAMPVKKYGCGFFRFTNSREPTLLTASTQLPKDTDPLTSDALDTPEHGIERNTIRAVSVRKSSYIRYYKKHKTRVAKIAVSPVDDTFISSSNDGDAYLWDSRKEVPTGRISLPKGPGAVAYDPKGLVLAVAHSDPKAQFITIKLYDVKSFGAGPFVEFDLQDVPADADIATLAFSPDGEHFLLTTNEKKAKARIYDSFKGEKLRDLVGHSNKSGRLLHAAFSPDSNYVLSGSDDGSVLIWNFKTGQLLRRDYRCHAIPSSHVAWNPVHCTVASAGQNVVFWLPELYGEDGRPL
eukprot:Plantae.Rhodophyta-Hildenbrandia_rubra.ctg11244.p1 GENE.Plantae.Rhodophyta-Hildenbrandia_rubra.ctg11244~~Plantae.Rhodophyta-Hildenbrandia_rubra.ctg11244.p1  ORF type:complete len:363 (-),score=51.91 Plantae.Rhodophyta-Hildenbrandia_rubra.ctg11244:889-1977(-)